MISCVVIFDRRVTRVFMTTHTRGCSDPAWNLVRQWSWCWKTYFETRKQSQKWEKWSFVHFCVDGARLYCCQQIVACPV